MQDTKSYIPFRIISSGQIPNNVKGWKAFLNPSVWDDWDKFCTLFQLVVVDEAGKQHEIGNVKIGQRGLKPFKKFAEAPPGHRKPSVQARFEQLEEEFFSVGQDAEYYSNLSTLGDTVREQILTSLRDVALDIERWEWAKDEYVMGESLLRDVPQSTVEGQFRRMANGDARLTRYDFSYSFPKRMWNGTPPYTLNFTVDPKSSIPTNVHVLIGRNGVGKTRLLSLMTKALVAKDATARQSGKFELNEEGKNRGTFANVVAVSFSAFDEEDLLPDRKPEPGSLGFSYIGLRGWTSKSPTAKIKTKSLSILASEFVESLQVCGIGARRRRWKNVINILQSDPVFRATQLIEMIDADLSEEENREAAIKAFKSLSSGHKIVLLSLTRLVEKVEERTLVLIDEPEGHLHPPLLSALTRAVSELMVQRNGVAIVATHSPVILQEVPKSCVWILDRLLTTSKAERPEQETFGENVGVLTREIFGLEVVNSGFHKLISDAVQDGLSYRSVVNHFNAELGAEAQAIIQALIAARDAIKEA